MNRLARFRFVTCLLLSAAVVLLAGCGMSAAERLDVLQQASAGVQEQIKQIDQDIESLSAALAEARDYLAALPADDALALQVQSRIEKALAHQGRLEHAREIAEDQLAKLDAAIDRVKADGSVGFADELDVYAEMIRDASPVIPPPYGWIAGLLGVIGGGIAAVLRNREKSERLNAEAHASYSENIASELVENIDTLLKENWTTEDEGKSLLRQAQSVHAKQFVRSAK